jgi:nucleoside phosphorylase
MMQNEVLVLAASKSELGWCSQRDGVQSGIIGTGKVQACANTMQIVQEAKPDAVFLVGWSGATIPSIRIGEGRWGYRCIQYDIDLQAFGFCRGIVPDGKGGQKGMLDLALPGRIEGVLLGCADRFLLRRYREENPWLEDLGIGMCDMESYAVAFACLKLGVSLYVYRVASDDYEGHRPKSFGKFMSEADKSFSFAFDTLLQYLTHNSFLR